MSALLRRTVTRAASTLGLAILRKDRREAEARALSMYATGYRELLSQVVGVQVPDLGHRSTLDLANLKGTSLGEGLFILDALRRTASVEGDVCEFGVAQGATSALMARAIRHERRKLCLFDSFEGLPAPTAKDVLINDIFRLGSMTAYQGRMKCPETMVRARLEAQGFPTSRTRVFKGFFDQVLASRRTQLPSRVSFAYVDFDFYEPIQQALGYLDCVLAPGGMIIIDDYGFFSAGAQAAVDEFIAVANASAMRYSLQVYGPPLGHFAVITRTA
ncbi:MAG: TylF/MycF/NovP-related O-methyltransferase [Pseudomonadota bacterium]